MPTSRNSGLAPAVVLALTRLYFVLIAPHPTAAQGYITESAAPVIFVPPPTANTPRVYASIHSPLGSGVIYVSGIIASFANIISAAFIFWRSYATKYQNANQKLTPSQRFPFYMAVLDCLTALCTMANLFYPFMKDHLLPHAGCVTIGFVTALFFSVNMTLVGSIAVITWLKVCRQYNFVLGHLDWKLWTISTVLPLIIGVITLVLNGYGEDTYWCFATNYSPGGKLEFVFTVAFNYITLGITSFCYLSVISRLHTPGNDLALSTSIAALKDPQNTHVRPANTNPLPEVSNVIFTNDLANSTCVSSFPSLSVDFSRKTPNHQHIYPPSSASTSSPRMPPKAVHPFTLSRISSLYSNMTGAGMFGASQSPEPRMPTYANTAEKRTDVSLQGATKKMSHYIFVHLIQYTPTVIYCIALLSGNQAWWVYFLTVTFLNLGGIAKAYAYMRNEGFRDKVRIGRKLQKSDENDFQYEESDVVHRSNLAHINGSLSPTSPRRPPDLLVLHRTNPAIIFGTESALDITSDSDEISLASLPVPPVHSRRRQQSSYYSSSQPTSSTSSGLRSPVSTLDSSGTGASISHFPIPSNYHNQYRTSSRPHSAFSTAGSVVSFPISAAASSADTNNPFRSSILLNLEAINELYPTNSHQRLARNSLQHARQSIPWTSMQQGPLSGSQVVYVNDINDEDYYETDYYDTEDDVSAIIGLEGYQQGLDMFGCDDTEEDSDDASFYENATRFKAKKISVVDFLKDGRS
ncbi:hypothetical protein BC936DRAFT_148588 [Jimgerdemannia flammicorona]|uniref:G-protein coupled receptors family 1 profile domain-containing protein n=1 Tax=Jimgerdemannia flammicorona TaxID=994334 RepID=A0A433D2Q2_9FUNG|nr:hypothetical protein BC936DRAFT_148588 [Jimgerdemannia flammicorona]